MDDSIVAPGGTCCCRRIPRSLVPVLVAALTAVVLGVATLVSTAYAAELQAFEAETMSETSNGITVVSSTSASGGKYLRYTAPAQATKTLSTTASGDAIVVKAKSKLHKGLGGEMEVYVGSSKVHEVRLNSSTWTNVTIPTTVPQGATLKIGSDFLENGRELHVDRVEVQGNSTPPPPPDADGDGIPDTSDNCMNASNPAQTDTDGDGVGDACDDDIDGDGRANADDYDPYDPNVQDPPSPASGDCDTPLQTQINNANVGDTINISGCTFREAVTVSKSLTIDGGGTATIKGSGVFHFSENTSDKTVPSFPKDDPGHCISNDSRCIDPAQVFVDGVEQEQVSSKPGAGEFSLDGSRHVVLGSDPAGKTVEVTTRTYILKAGANNISLNGITFEHSANLAQEGAVANEDFDNFNVSNSKILYAHGAGISVTNDAAGADLVGLEIAHNGQLGVHNSKGIISVRGPNCYVYDNGNGGYDPSWEAGGGKFSGILRDGNLHRATVDGCEVYDNSKGIWSDVSAQNIRFLNNRIHHNGRNGIQLEITGSTNSASDKNLVQNNVLYENGFSKPGWGWGGQILLSSSMNVDVSGNVVAWGPDGITVVSANRCAIKSLQCDYNNPKNISVHDNTILSTDRSDGSQSYGLAWLDDWTSPLFDASNDNGGANNAYWYPAPEGQTRYAWNGGYSSLSAFNATPGEKNGTYLSKAEKDAVVAAYRLPASPAN